MNLLLDELPEEYEGYLIRTDFRIGIQIRLALEDNELTEQEKIGVSLDLLFGNGKPPIETALNALLWYLKCGKEEVTESEDEADGREEAEELQPQRNFSFDVDDVRIYTAFRKAYGIDLKTARIHWFDFIGLMNDLGECAFTSVVDIRGKDISKLPKQQRNEYLKLKNKYALPQIYTEEEEAAINVFYSQLPA